MKANLALKKESVKENIYSAKVEYINDSKVSVSVFELADTQAKNLLDMGCAMYWHSDCVNVVFKREILSAIIFAND